MMNTEHPLYQTDLQNIAKYIAKWPLSRKKILIIGATGLIGSCLADAFIYYNRKIENVFWCSQHSVVSD